MIKLESNIGVMEGYAGSVAGILNAITTVKSKSAFVSRQMTKVSDTFMVDSIAANEAGRENISHVFDWPTDGHRGSSQPLFRLIKEGRGDNRFLSYEFIPSVKPVPLPDMSGVDREFELKPHVFRLKALVMETMERVTISPRAGKALFIPEADKPHGYIMTTKSVTVNPGGNSTGGFQKWWMEWFATRAQGIVAESSKLTEQYIAKTGQTVIRNSLGEFASGSRVSFAFADAEARATELMEAALLAEYEE